MGSHVFEGVDNCRPWEDKVYAHTILPMLALC